MNNIKKNKFLLKNLQPLLNKIIFDDHHFSLLSNSHEHNFLIHMCSISKRTEVISKVKLKVKYEHRKIALLSCLILFSAMILYSHTLPNYEYGYCRHW